MPSATVIQNPTAGDGAVEAESLRRFVADRGYEPIHATTDDDLDEVLQDPRDLVVAAGGDGTIGKVAARLFGRGVPLLILPLGTANNVARGLGVPTEEGLEALGFDWSTAARRTLDIGVARGPWGTRHFIESFGYGLFAHTMPVLSALKKRKGGPDDPDAELVHDRRALAALLDRYQARSLDLEVDGEPAGGELLVMEALNMPTMSANLCLAPGADPSDGALDLVRVGEDERAAMVEWLERGGHEEAPVPSRRVRQISFPWDGDPLHLDGRPWGGEGTSWKKVRTAEAGEDSRVVVELEREGVPVLVPG